MSAEVKLADLLGGDPTTPAWEEIPEAPGFAVLLAAPEASRDLAFLARAIGRYPSPEGEQRMSPQAWAEYQTLLLQEAVKDWRGLTVSRLRDLLPPPCLLTGELEQEVPYSAANRDLLLKLSPAFCAWISRALQQRTAARIQEEAELKNSSATPSITSTPMPEPAPAV